MNLNYIIVSIFCACILNGCVSADQTIAVIDRQTQYTAAELANEHDRTQNLLQKRSQLEKELSGMKTRRTSLEISDPVGNRHEIESLNRQIAKLQRDLIDMAR